MKALAHVPAVEVIAHRVVWSVPVAGLVLWWLGRTADLWAALRSPRMIGMAALTAALISVNWGIYVWAIQSGHALEAALGYYINPLFSIFLGAALLKERLAPAQMAAIRQTLASNDPQGYLTTYELFATQDMYRVDDLSSIQAPTLVATGELDPGSTPQMSRRLVAAVPHGRLRIIPSPAGAHRCT